MRARGFAPRAEVPLRWFFAKLAAGGYAEASGPADDPTFRARGPLPPGDPDLPETRARAIDPRSLPAFAVVRAMVEHVPEFLRGEKTGEEILFSPARLPLWFDYFSNDNLLYQINNRLGAEAVVRALPAGRPRHRRRDRRRLGLGGARRSPSGWRATARSARIGRYVFTEIVPTFLRRAERDDPRPVPRAADRVRHGST